MNDQVSEAFEDFAATIGDRGPVAVVGGKTQWALGGESSVGTKLVTAPIGIISYQAEEMTVRVGAGTTVADLHAVLAKRGQRTTLPVRSGGTVGGALMVGHSSIHRWGRGHLRDALLQANYVSADGQMVKAGGPTVKNVSGFDLCRVLVGSLGTLGLVGEVILRTVPIAAHEQWVSATGAQPWLLPHRLLTASAVLWDGTTTWVHLEGHPGDIASDHARIAADGFAKCDQGPKIPAHRRMLPPADLSKLPTSDVFVAEVGVGVVHQNEPSTPRAVSVGVRKLNEQIKTQFDPVGRLTPGRDPLDS